MSWRNSRRAFSRHLVDSGAALMARMEAVNGSTAAERLQRSSSGCASAMELLAESAAAANMVINDSATIFLMVFVIFWWSVLESSVEKIDPGRMRLYGAEGLKGGCKRSTPFAQAGLGGPGASQWRRLLE